MFLNSDNRAVWYVRLGLYLAGGILAIVLSWSLPKRPAQAQTAGDVAGPSAAPAPTAAPATSHTPAEPDKSINLLKLAMAGGVFMIPIFAMSALVMTMVIDRFLGLRRSKVMPEGLISGLGQMAGASGAFDPRKAYRLCQQYPSATANVIRAMLLRVGRPIAEVESTIHQASQREADRLYSNVRWLNLAASLSVMLGLIGTIQGMIVIFHQMQIMDPSADRASTLAGGIYTKLVCTFAGLSVAIPAAFFSHYFEGCIQSLFREIDEFTFNLLPQLERYEGRVRFGRHAEAGNGEMTDKNEVAAEPPPAAPRHTPPPVPAAS
jgi:biopolymer transport protein ExbB